MANSLKSLALSMAMFIAPQAINAATAAAPASRPAAAPMPGFDNMQQPFARPGVVTAPMAHAPQEMGRRPMVAPVSGSAAGQFTAPMRRMEMPHDQGMHNFGGNGASSPPPRLGKPNLEAPQFYVHSTDGQTYHMNGHNELYNDQQQRVDPTKVSGRMSMDLNGFRSKDGKEPAYNSDYMSAAEKFHGGTMINGVPHAYDGTSPRTESGYNPATFYGQQGTGHNGFSHTGSDNGSSAAHGAANQPVAVTSLNKYLTGTKPTLPTNGSGTATFDITNGTTVDLSVTSAYTVKNGQITFNNPAIAQAYDAASGKNSTVKTTSNNGILVNSENATTVLSNDHTGATNSGLTALMAAPAGTKAVLTLTLKGPNNGPETQVLVDAVSLGKGNVLLPNSNYSDVTKEAKQNTLPVTYTEHNGQTFTVYPAGVTPCTCTNLGGTMPGGGHWGGEVDHKGNINKVTINNKTININNTKNVTNNTTNVTNNLTTSTINNVSYITDTTTNTTISVAEYNYAITQMQAAYLNVSRERGGNGFFTVPSISVGGYAGTAGSAAVPTPLSGTAPEAGTSTAAGVAAGALAGVSTTVPVKATVFGPAVNKHKEHCTPCDIKHAIQNNGVTAHKDAEAVAAAIVAQALQQHKDFLGAQAFQQRQAEAEQRHVDAGQKLQNDAQQKLIAETIKNGKKSDTNSILLGLIAGFTALTAAGVWFRKCCDTVTGSNGGGGGSPERVQPPKAGIGKGSDDVAASGTDGHRPAASSMGDFVGLAAIAAMEALRNVAARASGLVKNLRAKFSRPVYAISMNTDAVHEAGPSALGAPALGLGYDAPAANTAPNVLPDVIALPDGNAPAQVADKAGTSKRAVKAPKVVATGVAADWSNARREFLQWNKLDATEKAAGIAAVNAALVKMGEGIVTAANNGTTDAATVFKAGRYYMNKVAANKQPQFPAAYNQLVLEAVKAASAEIADDKLRIQAQKYLRKLETRSANTGNQPAAAFAVLDIAA